MTQSFASLPSKQKPGVIVKYSGNPAELPGARHETTKALLRAGAFSLLVQHNASRLRNGTICVEDVDIILFVTGLVNDPDQRFVFVRSFPIHPHGAEPIG